MAAGKRFDGPSPVKFRWNLWTRKTHYWGAAAVAAPTLVIFGSGVLLQVKKQFTWIQPPTMRGGSDRPSLSFDRVLEIVSSIPEAGTTTWADIERLDVQPDRGIIKIKARNNWEVQVDHTTGEVLGSGYRRSDFIEGIHDGSFFHPWAKSYLFLPAGLGLLLLWCTGVYLFLLPFVARRRGRARVGVGLGAGRSDPKV